jgi:hypothetical protein
MMIRSEGDVPEELINVPRQVEAGKPKKMGPFSQLVAPLHRREISALR